MVASTSLSEFGLSKNSVFLNRETLLSAIDRHNSLHGSTGVRKEKTKSSVIVRSCVLSCAYRVRAIVPSKSNSWKVTVAIDHTCLGNLSGEGSSVLSPKFLSRDQNLINRIRQKPLFSTEDLRNEVTLTYGTEIEYWTAYRTLKMYKDIVFGSLERNYISLPYYLHELTRKSRYNIPF
ncbi:hypothetical protein RCL1_003946 [Eukaryota sp. TZLM3-RCL]